MDLHDARAITVRQPWAWAIAAGHKTIENRAASAARWKYRGPLLIHAGAAWSLRGGYDPRVRSAFWHAIMAPVTRVDMDDDEFRAVVAVAELVDVHLDATCCEPWGEQEYVNADGSRVPQVAHLVLENVQRIEPVHAPRGQLGLWRPDVELLEDVADQLEHVGA